jgi:hypothetical protein
MNQVLGDFAGLIREHQAALPARLDDEVAMVRAQDDIFQWVSAARALTQRGWAIFLQTRTVADYYSVDSMDQALAGQLDAGLAYYHAAQGEMALAAKAMEMSALEWKMSGLTLKQAYR